MPLRSGNRKVDNKARDVMTPDMGLFYCLDDSRTVTTENGERLALVTNGDGDIYAIHTDRDGNIIGTRRTLGYADAQILAAVHPELKDIIVVDHVPHPDKKGVFIDRRDSSFEDTVWCSSRNHGMVTRSIRTPAQVERIAKVYPTLYGDVDVQRDEHGRVRRIIAIDGNGKVSEEYRYDRERAKNLNRRRR